MYDVVVIGAGPRRFGCASRRKSGAVHLTAGGGPGDWTPVHCSACRLAVQNLDLELPDHVKALDVKGIRVIFPDGTEKLLTEEGYVLENTSLNAGWRTKPWPKAPNSAPPSRLGMERIYNSDNVFQLET